MKSKLSGLDQLIVEILQEKDYNLEDFAQQFGSTVRVKGTEVSPNAAFDTLARIKDPNTKLQDQDFEYLLQNIDDVDTDVERKLIAITYSDVEGVLKARAREVLNKLADTLKAKSLEPLTMTQPQIKTAPAEYGQFNAEVDNILNGIFTDTTGDIVQRMKTLSEISLRYYKAAGGDTEVQKQIASMDSRRMLTEIMLMDYFVEIVKSFDSGAGGYVFEYFLALLTGGKVTGKESGPGQGMGAIDFRSKDGTAGSAKYYRNKSNIKQAIGGFDIGVPVNYIVALKKQGAEQIDKTSRGASDPARIMAIDIYYMQVKRVSDGKFHITRLNKDGSLSGRPSVEYENNKLDLSQYIDERTKLSTLYISRVRTQTYKEMIYQAVSAERAVVVKELEKYIGSLRKAEVESKTYATPDGTIENGQATFDALFAAEQHFSDMVTSLDPNRVVADRDVTDKTKIYEINSLKALDKLIERVILYKNTEEK